MACVLCAGLLIDESEKHYRRGIFDYSTGLADCVLFLVGSMYILAGESPSFCVKGLLIRVCCRLTGSYPELKGTGAATGAEKWDAIENGSPQSELIDRNLSPKPPAGPHPTESQVAPSIESVSSSNNEVAVAPTGLTIAL